jgi:hypothetical protein
MKTPVCMVLAGAFAVAILLAARPATADAPAAAQAVLAQEHRWLNAIVAGDVKTVESILSEQPEYVHTTSSGELVSRAAEIASTRKESFTMNPTEETVDFSGNVALVRGLNTLKQNGKTIGRSRFTDVFVNHNGTWLALSAQESPVAP